MDQGSASVFPLDLFSRKIIRTRRNFSRQRSADTLHSEQELFRLSTYQASQ
jgi:hypothetical protein